MKFHGTGHLNSKPYDKRANPDDLSTELIGNRIPTVPVIPNPMNSKLRSTFLEHESVFPSIDKASSEGSTFQPRGAMACKKKFFFKDINSLSAKTIIRC